MQIYVNKYESAHRRLDFFLLANYHGGVEGQPHIFFNIMLPHTDNLATRPCKIAIVVLKFAQWTTIKKVDTTPVKNPDHAIFNHTNAGDFAVVEIVCRYFLRPGSAAVAFECFSNGYDWSYDLLCD